MRAVRLLVVVALAGVVGRGTVGRAGRQPRRAGRRQQYLRPHRPAAEPGQRRPRYLGGFPDMNPTPRPDSTPGAAHRRRCSRGVESVVTAVITDGPGYVLEPDTSAAAVRVQDNDAAALTLSVDADTVGEADEGAADRVGRRGDRQLRDGRGVRDRGGGWPGRFQPYLVRPSG